MSRTDLPHGKGIFIWKIKDMQSLYGLDFGGLAEVVKSLGFTWIQIKVADGIWGYNLKWTDGIWQDTLLRPFVQAMKDEGISVWGWHYIYGTLPGQEAKQSIRQVERLGLDGFIIDAERYYKNRPSQARTYVRQLREGLPDTPIALSSYRYPSVHPTFPFKEFLEHCDIHMPQVYWLGSSNPAWQLNKSVGELRALKNLPFVPVGAAYKEHGWMPKAEELDEFDAAVQEKGFPAITWWEFSAASRIDFLPVLAAHEWGDTPDVPPTDNTAHEDTLRRMQAVIDESRAGL